MRVAVPAALPGIAAGLLLTWLRAFGEFGATVILAYHPFSLPVFTFVQFDATGLPATMLPSPLALARRSRCCCWCGCDRRGDAGEPLPAPRAPAHPRLAAAAQTSRCAQAPGRLLARDRPRAPAPRLALLGPSGAGKTLTLRLLAGL